MRKIVLAFFLFAVVTAQAANNPVVNEKILKAFNETFIDTKDVTWTETDNISYAYFWQGEIKVRAGYDQEGHQIDMIRYYYEKQLEAAIVAKIKRRYAGATIFLVTEVTFEEDLVYVVTLHDDNFWYIVYSDTSGSLVETEKFKRAEK